MIDNGNTHPRVRLNTRDDVTRMERIHRIYFKTRNNIFRFCGVTSTAIFTRRHVTARVNVKTGPYPVLRHTIKGRQGNGNNVYTGLTIFGRQAETGTTTHTSKDSTTRINLKFGRRVQLSIGHNIGNSTIKVGRHRPHHRPLNFGTILRGNVNFNRILTAISTRSFLIIDRIRHRH